MAQNPNDIATTSGNSNKNNSASKPQFYNNDDFEKWLDGLGLGDYSKCKTLNGYTIKYFGIFENLNAFVKDILTPLITELEANKQSMPALHKSKFRDAYETAYTLTHSQSTGM